MTTQPNPGSDEAAALGCICPQMDNAHGIGYLGQEGRFVILLGCPLHSGDLDHRKTADNNGDAVCEICLEDWPCAYAGVTQ